MPSKDNFTFPFTFKACSLLSALQAGACVHAHLLKLGYASDIYSLNTLLHMYCQCGRLDNARQLFDEIPQRSVVSWSAMIAGYDHNGYAREALGVFVEMLVDNVRADETTLVSVLSACTRCGYLNFGESVHAHAIVNGLQLDLISLATALVDMYTKCGAINYSLKLFDRMPDRNVLSWSAMIGGLAMHGLGKEGLRLFSQMIDAGIEPTPITFTHILSACSHSGMVEKAHKYFQCMRDVYEIEPTIEHFGCMVDLLGRAGLLDQAVDFIRTMPMTPTGALWRSLLGSACTHRNLDVGKLAMENLIDLDDCIPGDYVMLANLYAQVGQWEEVAMVRTMMNNLGVRKVPGYSMIEVNGVIHKFVMGDRSHPHTELIYQMLDDVVGISTHWIYEHENG
ncbi:pentatricopeptide repeat-containing protein At4g21065-like [Magnolia sinica]|uniref:pentatricopeptide repeat-containing protein At4g21065-like n=1 Tax=Magnolia sinica TaxID=86752 RepID=UPI00265A427D|nr:pentatricopeptide repeat-containing protein At4g21065-like [Magnolia sinica]